MTTIAEIFTTYSPEYLVQHPNLPEFHRKVIDAIIRCRTGEYGFTAILHTWGRQLQYHPHIHYIVPGGGLSQDRSCWLPSRTDFYVPVKALSPIYLKKFKEEMEKAGLKEQIDPLVWNVDWNVNYYKPSETVPLP